MVDAACHEVVRALGNLQSEMICSDTKMEEMQKLIKQQHTQIETLIGRVDSLTVTTRELNERNTVLESAVTELRKCIDETKELSEDEKKKENFYQDWLAETLDGGHRTTEAGITDVSTESFDMEIKTFKKWKLALRQVHAYNECTKTGKKILALFDVKDDYRLDKLVAACKIFDVRLIFLGSDKSYRNVFPANETLGDQWRYDVEALLRVLLLQENVKVNIEHDPQLYISDNDPFKEYMDQHIKADNDPQKYLQWQDLRESFRVWHDKRYEPRKLTKQAKDVKRYFCGKLGEYEKTTRGNVNVRGWFGWQLT